jgi:hypothetical protein
VDWSQYDNTGDGFVDVLTVIHPTTEPSAGPGGNRGLVAPLDPPACHPGSACPEPRGSTRTSTQRPDGDGYIYVNDYTSSRS